MIEFTYDQVMWTLEQGRAEIQRVQSPSRKFGYHVCLGGSVLNAGESSKDLAVYFLPLDLKSPQPDRLLAWLATMWGSYTPLNDPRYTQLAYYRHKLRFDIPKRIDVFVV